VNLWWKQQGRIPVDWLYSYIYSWIFFGPKFSTTTSKKETRNMKYNKKKTWIDSNFLFLSFSTHFSFLNRVERSRQNVVKTTKAHIYVIMKNSEKIFFEVEIIWKKLIEKSLIFSKKFFSCSMKIFLYFIKFLNILFN
jgi:hypothetical protein